MGMMLCSSMPAFEKVYYTKLSANNLEIGNSVIYKFTIIIFLMILLRFEKIYSNLA